MGGFSANVVVFGGYLAADPETKDLSNKETMTKFRLAIPNGDDSNTIYLSVSTFGKQAEACAGYLAKGSAVLIEGKLHQSQWVGAEGEKKTSLVVNAQRVTFVPKQGTNKDSANP